MTPLRFISLFSGIGGLDLGLERAGMQCVAQVEIDAYAQRVLAKHWPDVPRFADVRTVGAHNLPVADLICGGFPCQDISSAGKGAGIAEGTRSGLWFEFARIIRELHPAYVLIENVAALRARGLSVVTNDLAAIGYDTEWETIAAASVGAPHRRERLFLVAYPSRPRHHESQQVFARGREVGNRLTTEYAVDWNGVRIDRSRHPSTWPLEYESSARRMDDGLSAWMDRIRGLGNAVVPQVAEFVGRRIVQHAMEGRL